MHNFAAPTSALLSAAAPYQWLLSLFGLSPPPPLVIQPPNRARLCVLQLVYSLHALLLLALNFWSTYLNCMYLGDVVSHWHLDGITKGLSIGISASVWAVQLVLQLTAHLGQRRLRHIFATLARLEHDVRWLCEQRSEPAASAFDGNLHRYLACRSGALLLLQFLLLPFFTYVLVAAELPEARKYAISFFHLLLELKYVEYCVVVQLVHALLQQLQRHLQQLRCELLQQERHVLRQALYVDLRENQRLLARIWQLVDAVEQYYAVPMLTLFLFNGLSITETVNWVYMHATYSWHNNNSYRFYYMAILVVCMLIPCWLSQSCIETYQEFGAELHNLQTNGRDAFLSLRLREYSLQLMHLRLVFTCGGFFDINLKYFGTMVLTLITYIVILIQFKLQAEAEKEAQELLASNH